MTVVTIPSPEKSMTQFQSLQSSLSLFFTLGLTLLSSGFAHLSAQEVNPELEINRLLNETRSVEAQDLRKSLSLVSEGIRLSDKIGSPESKVEFYLNGAKIAHQLHDSGLSERFIKQAILASRTLGDPHIIGNVKLAEGRLRALMGAGIASKNAFLKAKAAYQNAKNPTKLVETNLELALVCAELGDPEEAEDFSHKALAGATALDDLDLIGKSHQCVGIVPLISRKIIHASPSNAVIAMIDPDRERATSGVEDGFSVSLEALETAIGFFKQSGNQSEIASCLKYKGDIMAARSRWPQALDYYEESLELMPVGPKASVGLIALARALFKLGQETEALSRLGESSQLMDPANATWIKILEADFRFKMSEPSAALKALEAGIANAKSDGNPQQLHLLFLQKSIVEKQQKDFEAALASMEQSHKFEKQLLELATLEATKQDIPQLSQSSQEEERFQKNRTYFLESRLYDYEKLAGYVWVVALIFALCCLLIFLLKYDAEKKAKTISEYSEARIKEVKSELIETRSDRDSIIKDLAQELRTPMNGIVGAVPIFNDTPLNELQQNCLNIIDISSRSILTLIHDISDFSNLDEGKVTLAEESMDLVLLTETVAQLFDADSSYTDKKLICEVPSDPLPMLSGDANRIQQILLTLVGRSFQTTQGSFVHLRLERLVPKSARDFRVRLTVEDIKSIADLDKLNEIFDPKPTRTDANSIHRPASMMGMAIVKKLVDAMHGSIEVLSNDQSGTRIIVTLPFLLQPDQESWEPQNPYERFPRKRVLVVDQNNLSRKVLCNHLRTWGLDIEMVESFDDIIPMLEANMNFDLISLDTTDSGSALTNLEKVSAIRSCEGGREVPILLVSHFSELNQPTEMKRQRNIHRVAMPLQITQLHNVIRQAIHNKASSNQSFAKLTPASGKSAERTEAVVQVDPNDGFKFIPYILPFKTEQKINPDLRILLAEDNIVNQRVTSLLLKKIGFVIDIVPNGKEAVDRVAQGGYDVVLMDKVMPVLDGLEATKQIRKLEHVEQPIIIALTASASMDDEIACRKATMDNFLAKPVQLEKMKAGLAFASRVIDQRNTKNS